MGPNRAVKDCVSPSGRSTTCAAASRRSWTGSPRKGRCPAGDHRSESQAGGRDRPYRLFARLIKVNEQTQAPQMLANDLASRAEDGDARFVSLDELT